MGQGDGESGDLSLPEQVGSGIVGDGLQFLVTDGSEITFTVGEKLSRLPQPINEVIVLIGSPGGERELSGVNLGGTFIVVRPEDYEYCVEEKTVFAHELVHFYPANRGRSTPTWFREGGAHQVVFLVHLEMYNLVFSYTGDPCPAVSLQQLLDDEAAVGYLQHQSGPLFACNYVIGQTLLGAVADAMGAAAFKTAWRELQMAAAAGLGVTDPVIRDTFRRHTPSSKITLFDSAYAIWHKGEFN